ncbi:hypothetical protein [Peptostreptococcus sp. D1]|uniref:hypothetical protein n=1 Tax=Peptostreptococcus sp. D1 TaxID=72304 RepID=UPI003FA79E66
MYVLKLFMKTLASLLSVTLVATSLAACSKKSTDEPDKTQTTTTKIEYITEITKENVEDIVIEYKEVLSYYNDLKNNLKILSDISKDPQLERDAITAKDSIKNGETLLGNLTTKYKPLFDAKEVLKKMYSISLEMSDSVVNDSATYEKKLKEYDELFKDFKKRMDQIRTDIEKIRGKSPTQDEPLDPNAENKDKNTDVNKSSDKDNKNKSKDSSSSKSEDTNNGSSKNNSSSSNSGKASGSNSQNSGKDQIISENSSEFVPKVSSLNSSIRGEIKNAGYSAGTSYKQSGGDASNLKQVAAQMFNDIEGDNPINSSQIAEARQIFVNAFISAYNSN